MKAECIIKEFARKNHIKDIGICTAEPFENMRESFEKNRFFLKGFAEADIEKRINPSLTLKNAKSIIVVAKSYNMGFDRSKDTLKAKISAGAAGDDYHGVITGLLKKLAEELKKEYTFEYKIFSDTGALSDRCVAERSGIGDIGENGCIVAKNGGSAVFIGYMITDLELKGFDESKNVCIHCGKCVELCPTGALSRYGYSIEKCISYLTQVKRVLKKEEMRLLGNNIYGCDICQLCCPCNETAEMFKGDDIYFQPEINMILSLTNKSFKEIYGKTAMFWRGNTIIKRNAIIAAANSKSKEAENLIKPFLNSESEILRETAKNALEMLKEQE